MPEKEREVRKIKDPDGDVREAIRKIEEEQQSEGGFNTEEEDETNAEDLNEAEDSSCDTEIISETQSESVEEQIVMECEPENQQIESVELQPEKQETEEMAVAEVEEKVPEETLNNPYSVPEEELRLLKKLYEAGVLTEEEFKEKKKMLLKI